MSWTVDSPKVAGTLNGESCEWPKVNTHCVNYGGAIVRTTVEGANINDTCTSVVDFSNMSAADETSLKDDITNDVDCTVV